jgi:hypothetical protein
MRGSRSVASGRSSRRQWTRLRRDRLLLQFYLIDELPARDVARMLGMPNASSLQPDLSPPRRPRAARASGFTRGPMVIRRPSPIDKRCQASRAASSTIRRHAADSDRPRMPRRPSSPAVDGVGSASAPCLAHWRESRCRGSWLRHPRAVRLGSSPRRALAPEAGRLIALPAAAAARSSASSVPPGPGGASIIGGATTPQRRRSPIVVAGLLR